MTRKRVLVGMSGGVDSATAAALLVEQGYVVSGAIMKIWDDAYEVSEPDGNACFGPDEVHDIEEAQRVCDILGIELHVVDLTKEYSRTVLEYFTSEYEAGRTPNPCVRCNWKMKFGYLLSRARESGIPFDYFATGHYARVRRNEESGRWALLKGADCRKDQSYFLCHLTQEQLGTTLFPLGELEKSRVKELSERFGLGLAHKKESQNFIAGGYSCLFPSQARPGEILDVNGRVVGRHEGIRDYTVGQRRKIAVKSEAPLYVLSIDAVHNTITVGERPLLYGKSLTAREVHWVSVAPPQEALRVTAKIRYRHGGGAGELQVLENGRISIVFDEPQLSITPGQSVVFYGGDELFGGGIIE